MSKGVRTQSRVPRTKVTAELVHKLNKGSTTSFIPVAKMLTVDFTVSQAFNTAAFTVA